MECRECQALREQNARMQQWLNQIVEGIVENTKPKADIVTRGSVYEIDGRRGKLTIRLLEDVDYSKDTFYEAEIVEGTARFASNHYKAMQQVDGLGEPGSTLSFRTTLHHLVKRRPDLE